MDLADVLLADSALSYLHLQLPSPVEGLGQDQET